MSSDEIRRGDVLLFRDRLFKAEGSTPDELELVPVKKLATNRGYVNDGEPQRFKRSSVEETAIPIESIGPNTPE